MQEQPLILLVEDNESHALLTIRGLEEQSIKCKIKHVWDGEEAMEYLFRQGNYADPKSSPVPRLVLLDLRLPRIDGLEVLRAIKMSDHLKLIPVIILTSSLAEPDIVNAYMLNVNSYLTKPVDFDEFRRQLGDLSKYWLNWNIYPL